MYAGVMSETDESSILINKVRDYNMTMRAMHFYNSGSSEVLFAFPAIYQYPTSDDRYTADTRSYLPTNPQFLKKSLTVFQIPLRIPNYLKEVSTADTLISLLPIIFLKNRVLRQLMLAIVVHLDLSQVVQPLIPLRQIMKESILFSKTLKHSKQKRSLETELRYLSSSKRVLNITVLISGIFKRTQQKIQMFYISLNEVMKILLTLIMFSK